MTMAANRRCPVVATRIAYASSTYSSFVPIIIKDGSDGDGYVLLEEVEAVPAEGCAELSNSSGDLDCTTSWFAVLCIIMYWPDGDGSALL